MGKNTAAADSKTGKQIQQKMNQLINLKRCYVISSGLGPYLPPCSSASVRKHKPELLGGGSLERCAMVDVWLDVEAQHHHPAAVAIMLHCIIAPLVGGARDQAVVEESVGKLRAVLDVYEARLSRSSYLAGDFVSAADLSHFPLMRYFMATEYAVLVGGARRPAGGQEGGRAHAARSWAVQQK